MRIPALAMNLRHEIHSMPTAGVEAGDPCPRNMFPIALREDYASVGRTLLWEALTRLGVPSRMIKVSRMFHDSTLGQV